MFILGQQKNARQQIKIEQKNKDIFLTQPKDRTPARKPEALSALNLRNFKTELKGDRSSMGDRSSIQEDSLRRERQKFIMAKNSQKFNTLMNQASVSTQNKRPALPIET